MGEEVCSLRGGSRWGTRLCVLLAWGAALILRVACVLLGAPSVLGRRVEISTPVNSFMRLAEGYWLKRTGFSPYTGSTYHGSPLLLALFGPFTSSSTGGLPALGWSLSMFCIIADLIAALLLLRIGRSLQSAQSKQLICLNFTKYIKLPDDAGLGVGDIAAIAYLWNPFTIVNCVGGCTSSIENAMILLSLYGAAAGNVPLAAFGWVVSTHCSFYPAVLLIPIGLSLTVGIDHLPKKLFKSIIHCESSTKEPVGNCLSSSVDRSEAQLGKSGSLKQMVSETYGFILNVDELSPNLGLFWYFFTEVFDFFRPFFLLVFHANILFMILPLTIRLHHRPLFLAFVFCSIVAMLKSYPSVGDTTLYLGLMPLFRAELSGMRFTFFLLNGYVGVALLSPVMYNLWIWRIHKNMKIASSMSDGGVDKYQMNFKKGCLYYAKHLK
ncbi:hypothetical protein KP509_1Z115700 [Ceratopteris richardii]|nr:hypothetical protein KP509_1Z115700 [Ceratopteris richardii]